jgi:hypothetical protein
MTTPPSHRVPDQKRREEKRREDSDPDSVQIWSAERGIEK